MGGSSPFCVWYGAFAVSIGIVLWCELGGLCLLCLGTVGFFGCFCLLVKIEWCVIWGISSWAAHRFRMDGVGWV